MTLINLGKDKNNNNVIWDLPHNTSLVIEGLQGSGKSYIGSLVLSQLLHRNIIIFDYEGEHHKRLRQSPAKSEFPSWWSPTIYRCFDPYFNFQQMGRFDLMGLNIAEGGALILSELAKVDECWDEVKKMIYELPTTRGRKGEPDKVIEYNKKWSTRLREPIIAPTKQSLVIKMPILDEIFGTGGELYYLPDLIKDFKHISLDFSFKGMQEAGLSRARLFFGKFLEQIWDHLYEFSPVIFVEEAKIVAPNLNEGETFKSHSKLNEFQLHQRRRTGSMLICVIQDEELLSKSIKNTYAFKIKHQFNDNQNRRWFTIGDNNYWKGSSGKHSHFYVHNLGYV